VSVDAAELGVAYAHAAWVEDILAAVLAACRGGHVEVWSENREGRVCVYIRDDGPDEASIHPRIVELFEWSQPMETESYLDLSRARLMALKMEGDLYYETTDDGVLVVLALPAPQDQTSRRL